MTFRGASRKQQGRTVLAKYRVTAPGGKWDAADPALQNVSTYESNLQPVVAEVRALQLKAMNAGHRRSRARCARADPRASAAASLRLCSRSRA